MEDYRFRKLIVWKRSMALAKEVHALASQMRRAAMSIPANIAEGNARNSRPDYLRFLAIAAGSLAELETHIELTRELQLLPPDSLTVAQGLLNETGALLTRLTQALRKQEALTP